MNQYAAAAAAAAAAAGAAAGFLCRWQRWNPNKRYDNHLWKHYKPGIHCRCGAT